jgi:tRNA G18 (ribose-2'-O)-methylase SpoU
MRKQKREIVLILHNIRSLHNVGSIFRTADAIQAKKIYLVGITPDPVDRLGRAREPLVKVSLGAEKNVPWEKVSSFAKLARILRRDGYTICVLEQSKRAILYSKFPRKIRKIALVLGHEVRGLPPSVLENSDFVLEIPMRGAVTRQSHHPRHSHRGKESLNVSVAAGVALFRIIYP